MNEEYRRETRHHKRHTPQNKRKYINTIYNSLRRFENDLVQMEFGCVHVDDTCVHAAGVGDEDHRSNERLVERKRSRDRRSTIGMGAGTIGAHRTARVLDARGPLERALELVATRLQLAHVRLVG